MALQILRKTASDFTPAGGSNISFDVDHLKCDDYLIGASFNSNILVSRNPSTGRIWMRIDGGAPAAVWYAPADLSSWTQVNLSDGNIEFHSGLCADDEDNFYIVNNTAKDMHKYNNAGILQWGGLFTAYQGCFFYTGNNHIYACDLDNHRVREVDKNGNIIHIHLLTGDNAWAQYPTSVFLDSNGIYINTRYGIIIYDLSWNYQSFIDTTFTATMPDRYAWYCAGLLRLSNGDFILRGADYGGHIMIQMLQLSSGGVLKRLTSIYGENPEKGEIKSDGSLRTGNTVCFGVTENNVYSCSYRNNYVVKIDIRNASQRYAEYQHDFGLSVNIQRLDVNALYDNRDESWKSMRLWYQLDGGGYVEVDMKDPLLAINGQVLDLKIGMTSYGFLRHWPEFYSIDIVYEDGLTPVYIKKLDARAI